jgi:NAD(P)-dependent dehydrogenase (short-subunit alcohol dehydrogenase family)
MARTALENPADRKAYIITGPTSGIGRRTALEVARHGTVVLVGRDPGKLEEVRKTIEQKGQHAVSVVCDLSEPSSVRRAAAEIVALNLPIVGLLNNAGIAQTRPTKNSLGWDLTFATDHLGPFALTEALVPHLSDGGNVVFVASTVEDPERNPGKTVGYRGARYISAEASARGEWQPGGSKLPGADAYATSKQCNLATVMAFARETPRLRFSAVTPGLIPTTGLVRRDAKGLGGWVSKSLSSLLVPLLVPLLMPFMKFLSTIRRAARVITKILVEESGRTGTYFNQQGQPILGSALVCDPNFQDRVVSETRALLATVHS